ncbi:MAG: PKD domain-containing protein [Acidobacteria bacterium]|nr:PKD domain-containing protein [Acidobacteriota bacterium]
MKKLLLFSTATFVLLLLTTTPAAAAAPGGYTLVGWNNLGMHCMDADYSVFSLLPPYNTIHAQLVDPQGVLLTPAAGVTVQYEAVADTSGSINTTSVGKTNFWTHVLDLFGASPAPDMGLAGRAMPGPANTPRPMAFDPAFGWFIAEGIPITPRDDAGAHNPYPMMRLTARDSAGAVLATTDIVLPVSDEMTCTACHASGSNAAAAPLTGWINDPDPTIDFRLNILLRHDQGKGAGAAYRQALIDAGYDETGLYATATSGGKPILCARCHASNALPGTGLAGIPALTNSMHALHAPVVDPATGLTLDASANRGACYRCHPGSTTRCLRGAMGSAVAADGTMKMQCQSCHGSMAAVGDPARQGWLDEPDCQSCHTGTETHNNGQIRYTSAFESSGRPRAAIDRTFATTPDAPAPGLSLFRFSTGHGGLACEACHGSTHAEFPSSHANDNVQSARIQGAIGPLAECGACHATTPATVTGGPHGMHPVGQSWFAKHSDVVEQSGTAGCQACHGLDFRGTVLSYARADRTVTAFGSTKSFWRGFEVGCYACHRGPKSDSRNPNHPPRVQNAAASTISRVAVPIPLHATDADGDPLTLRVVSQPAHGTVALAGATASYVSEAGFSGADAFTFAAWDGQTDGNLGSASIAVSTNNCALDCSASVPTIAHEGTPVPFQAFAAPSGCAGSAAFAWTFGDGSTGAAASMSHVYATSGIFDWALSVSVAGLTCARSGAIRIEGLPPNVTSIRKLSGPFRIVVIGSNFHPGLQVEIHGSPFPGVVQRGTTKLTLRGGSALRALFPAGTEVMIRFINPDDAKQSVIMYNVTTNAWRTIP